MILGSGIMVLAIDWSDSKAVAITALGIYVFTQMVHGGSWKSISNEKTLATIQMDLLFAWSSFLFGAFHQ